MKPKTSEKDNSKKEEWGGWKIVSDMLDNPYENGIYRTSECYQKLYEFVVEQKAQSRREVLDKLIRDVECNGHITTDELIAFRDKELNNPNGGNNE